LKEGFELHEAFLYDLGWVLSVKEEEAGVYRTFNGKLRKTPDVYIQYHELTYDYTDSFDDNGNQIEYTKPSERPWYVRSNTTDQASSFKKLGAAIDNFIHFSKVAAVKLSLKNNA
jgi:hypothetical protein